MMRMITGIAAAAIISIGISCAESQDTKITNALEQMKSITAKSSSRTAAMNILIGIGKPAVPRLLKELKNNDAKVIRSYMCVTLGKIGDKSATDAVREALKDEEPEVRAAACEGISELIGEEAIPELIEMFKDIHVTPREEARKALAKMEDAVITPLIACFEKPGLQYEAQTVLTQIGAKSVPKLIDTLADDNADVVVLAAKSLSAIGDKSALDPIKEAMDKHKSKEKQYRSIKGAYDELKQKP